MVKTELFCGPRNPPLGFDRAISTVNGPVTWKSCRIGMEKVWLVWPGVNTSVPEVEV